LFSYVREVQPAFDRHCGRCHDFGKPAGEKLNLAADRPETFNVSYTELWRKKFIKFIGAGPAQTQPACREALAIIRAGQAMLAQRPRGDAETIATCDVDQRRERKYAQRQQEETRFREAVRQGSKAYDAPTALAVREPR
jgi:hypothetical protein